MTIAVSDAIGIDARSEIYGAQGMAMMNRVYRLRWYSGEPVFLFEQLGLGSNVETASMQEIAEEMANRAAGRVRELGRYEGRVGLCSAGCSERVAQGSLVLRVVRAHHLSRPPCVPRMS